jgi:Z1 domain
MAGFFEQLCAERKDDAELSACVERVVEQLHSLPSSVDGPGMLLGKIQSGKTRGFLGVIAKAFDEGFDIAIVLTKGTITLANQTVKRIGKDFKSFIDDDRVVIFDIMEMPERLTKAEQRRKIVIVAKKQAKNMERVLDLFDKRYPELRDKRVLLVDDEADLASVRFVKKKDSDVIEQGKIAQQMDDLRALVKSISFFQVTATPYSLYLQPATYQNSSDSNFVFKPKRPAFTEVLPTHAAYVGGDDYFGDFDETDPRSYLYIEVPPDEQDALRTNDGRAVRSDRLYTSDNIRVLRRGLVTFMLGVALRRWQQRQGNQPLRKYAMVIHNDTMKKAHEWQWDVVTRLLEIFRSSVENDDVRFTPLFDTAYEDLARSIGADGGEVPSHAEAFGLLRELVLDEDVHAERVNSDIDLKPLLDQETAELKLRAAANIFIGGSILDRGITIPNLLAFYYGRNPKTMQADTVLQHSRMYGARDRRDLAATRFYTSRAVHDRLQRIHELETALREAFLNGSHDRGVAFVRLDESGTIRPCAPNKIMFSDIVAIRPGGRLLPVGFQSLPKYKIEKKMAQLDALIDMTWRDKSVPTSVPIARIHDIVDAIQETLNVEEIDWDWSAFHAAADYFVKAAGKDNNEKQVLLLPLTDRNISRTRMNGRFQNSPDDKLQRDIAEQYARKIPMLGLFKMSGSLQSGWAGHPFWWPVLFAPHEAQAVVYSSIDPATL